jgi:gamma-glutamylcyclotransferase (GGCT)/AIG2-like uncharacterized protein YtfP
VIKAFVYGTLRIGEYNYRWASGDVVEEIPNVLTTGELYFAGDGPSYPVAKLDTPGQIIGDILVYPDDSQDWLQICRMELGAGYELREIEVTTESGDKIAAVAWHFLHHPRGPKIASGDWSQAVENFYRVSENA